MSDADEESIDKLVDNLTLNIAPENGPSDASSSPSTSSSASACQEQIKARNGFEPKRSAFQPSRGPNVPRGGSSRRFRNRLRTPNNLCNGAEGPETVERNQQQTTNGDSYADGLHLLTVHRDAMTSEAAQMTNEGELGGLNKHSEASSHASARMSHPETIPGLNVHGSDHFPSLITCMEGGKKWVSNFS